MIWYTPKATNIKHNCKQHGYYYASHIYDPLVEEYRPGIISLCGTNKIYHVVKMEELNPNNVCEKCLKLYNETKKNNQEEN